MENVEKKIKHTLCVKEEVTVTGVSSVISLGEKEVRLALTDKCLTLTGRNFCADKLSLEEGTLVLSGETESIRYTPKTSAKGLLKRLFK